MQGVLSASGRLLRAQREGIELGTRVLRGTDSRIEVWLTVAQATHSHMVQ